MFQDCPSWRPCLQEEGEAGLLLERVYDLGAKGCGKRIGMGC